MTPVRSTWSRETLPNAPPARGSGLRYAMRASEYQRLAEARLKRHFDDVRVEWSVVKAATDALQRDIHRYAPRVDIAIGPLQRLRSSSGDALSALTCCIASHVSRRFGGEVWPLHSGQH